MNIVRRTFGLAAAGEPSSMEEVRKRERAKANDKPGRQIAEYDEIFGADSVYVGSVAEVDGDLIRLSATDVGLDNRPNHYIPMSAVARIEHGAMWLKINASDVVSFEKGTTTYAS
jgi:hypothetical protein